MTKYPIHIDNAALAPSLLYYRPRCLIQHLKAFSVLSTGCSGPVWQNTYIISLQNVDCFVDIVQSMNSCGALFFCLQRKKIKLDCPKPKCRVPYMHFKSYTTPVVFYFATLWEQNINIHWAYAASQHEIKSMWKKLDP